MPIGTNTLHESAMSGENSSKEDVTFEEGTPQTEIKSYENQIQDGDLSKLICQQARDTTPRQPISTAVSVVQ